MSTPVLNEFGIFYKLENYDEAYEMFRQNKTIAITCALSLNEWARKPIEYSRRIAKFENADMPLFQFVRDLRFNINNLNFYLKK